jgi:valyl-tRNA synthetase
MGLPKQYKPAEIEPGLMQEWQTQGVYHFEPGKPGAVYSIDTPPPTVSGHLHLGHVYSYSHADFIARYRRMRGDNVFYPMGYDDNGLPTERLVEKRLGIDARQVGRSAFIEQCLQVSEQAEREYQALWQRLGLSIDWRYTYRTIDDPSRRIAQRSFIELYQSGLAYRSEAPTIWCPECRTAIAQAELNDLEHDSEFITLRFTVDGDDLPIATTRPELLPACVAVFVHPEDARFKHLVGKTALTPLFEQRAPILADPAADPNKGSGAVMCCTFGDTTDVSWVAQHKLPVIAALDAGGRMTAVAGQFAGLSAIQARRQIKEALAERGLVLARQPTRQTLRVHERCDTPVEFLVVKQWFIRLLDFKEQLLQAGAQVNWRPSHMQARYQSWVENLNWDWCISRQRYFGVPFPLWYCQECGAVNLPGLADLPVDPLSMQPRQPCACGSLRFTAETDVLDTWATSSMSPQIVGRWGQNDGENAGLFEQVFPFSLRPQAHEIIRTWAFYTIAKTHFHFAQTPWENALISGWGLAAPGEAKISKSRGGGPMPPFEMIQTYSADAVRYWAASAGPGKDAVISADKIQNGARLATKLWNVARFSERFLEDYFPPTELPDLTPADAWILARLQQVIRQVSVEFETYDYAAAKSIVETFFWRDLADNYLEMCKQRLYDPSHPQRDGALYSVYHVLLEMLKLFAPVLPYVTEAIYKGLFTTPEHPSIHRSPWPAPNPSLESDSAITAGELLVEIATAVRRYKSERNLPLSSELQVLQLAAVATGHVEGQTMLELSLDLQAATADLAGVTRARQIEIVNQLDPQLKSLGLTGVIQAAIQPI